jgi:hypothetical protein
VSSLLLNNEDLILEQTEGVENKDIIQTLIYLHNTLNKYRGMKEINNIFKKKIKKIKKKTRKLKTHTHQIL